MLHAVPEVPLTVAGEGLSPVGSLVFSKVARSLKSVQPPLGQAVALQVPVPL